MNFFEIFFNAPLSIQAIMLLLFLASIYSWSIILQKVFLMKRINRKFAKFETKFWSGNSIEELYEKLKGYKEDPVYSIFVVAMDELNHFLDSTSSKEIENKKNLLDRMEIVMYAQLKRSLNDISNNLSFLSSLGTNGVIIGLFGTVLGIMNSFQSIADHKNTSLAVVAPGIAEALFATAIGLAAAIPAALAYNKITFEMDNYSGRVECFIEEFRAIMSRQLEL